MRRGCVVLMPADGKPLLDPSKEEADEGGDSMTLAVMASTGEVTQWIMEGRREVRNHSSCPT